MEEGIAQMRQGLDAWRSRGMDVLVLILSCRAWPKPMEWLGKLEKGWTLVEEALDLVEKTEERWWEAEVHRVKGELLQLSGKALRGRGLLPPGHRGRPSSGGEILGTACHPQPEPPAPERGPIRRGPAAPLRDLRLVHRGLRYPGSAGGQGLAGCALREWRYCYDPRGHHP